MHYTVIRWNGKGSTAAIHHRQRRDAAALCLRSEIYAMLESEGLLDRQVAYDLMNAADEWVAINGRTDGKRVFTLRNNVAVYIDQRRA